MLVYTKREGLTVESKNFRIISVPINEEILKNFEGNMYKYKESDTYFSIGIYKGIITLWLLETGIPFGDGHLFGP